MSKRSGMSSLAAPPPAAMFSTVAEIMASSSAEMAGASTCGCRVERIGATASDTDCRRSDGAGTVSASPGTFEPEVGASAGAGANGGNGAGAISSVFFSASPCSFGLGLLLAFDDLVPSSLSRLSLLCLSFFDFSFLAFFGFLAFCIICSIRAFFLASTSAALSSCLLAWAAAAVAAAAEVGSST